MIRLPLHNALKPLSWLVGTWRTSEVPGEGRFPTITPFQYCEEMKFTSVGQPTLNYEAQTYHAENKNPLHREVGFLKIIEGTNRCKLVLAHVFGLITIEEGVMNNNSIHFETTSLARMSEGNKDPVVTKLRREFKGDGKRLEHTLYMATAVTPELVQHLHATYLKYESEKD